jgi:hypothetical protein
MVSRLRELTKLLKEARENPRRPRDATSVQAKLESRIQTNMALIAAIDRYVGGLEEPPKLGADLIESLSETRDLVMGEIACLRALQAMMR